MSLPIPNLDDRSFDSLMKEARSLIPIYHKEWTNHNPSDPGITFLELFAWLCDMTMYRINQIPEENYRKFLALLGIGYLFNWDEVPGTDVQCQRLRDFLVQNYGAGWVKTAKIEKNDENTISTIKVSHETNSILFELKSQDIKATMTFDGRNTYDLIVKREDGHYKVFETIGRDIQRCLKEISRCYRAITSDDFEFLTLECMEELENGQTGRAICVNNMDLEYNKRDPHPQPGHVSVIVIPRDEEKENELINRVKEYLDKRRLITTRVHVVPPDYREITLSVNVVLKENTVEQDVLDKAKASIEKYFHPLEGGQDGGGWPLGRSVYRSEIYHLLEGIPGIDHVEKIKINNFDVNFVKIETYQLVKISINIDSR